MNKSWLPRSCPATACFFKEPVILFNTIFLWLLRDRVMNVIWRNLHIASKTPLNRLSVSTTATSTMPSDNTTSSIINLASYCSLVSIVMYDIVNCARSHIVLRRLHSWGRKGKNTKKEPYPFSLFCGREEIRTYCVCDKQRRDGSDRGRLGVVGQ